MIHPIYNYIFRVTPALAIVFLFSVGALAQAGRLDTTFNFDGHVQTALFGGMRDTVYATVVQPDGKVIVAAESQGDFALVRYNVNGSLDTTFHGTGKVIAAVTARFNLPQAMALQPDGKIVVVGGGWYVTNTGSQIVHRTDFAIARFNTDGTLDSSFDGDGRATASFDGSYASAQGVAVQPDGRIVVVGYTSPAGTRIAVARYNPDGSLDETFDGDGKLVTPVEERSRANAVAIQTDGKIVIVGSSNEAMTTVRYQSTGAIDTSFGDAGVARVAGSGAATSLAICPDGKILVAGQLSSSSYVMVRYAADGQLDTGFDKDGIWVPPSTHEVGNPILVLQGDGKIIIGGTDSYKFAAVRLHENAVPDPTFGSGGKVVTPVSKRQAAAMATALAPDGKIIIAGHALDEAGNPADIGVVRYQANGALDTTFDNDGKVLTDVAGRGGSANGMVIQPDGKIVVAGSALGVATARQDIAIVRYNPDGLLDSSFGSGGKVFTSVGSDSLSADAIALQPDGKIVVAGQRSTTDGYRIIVVRYHTDGSLDGTFGEAGTAFPAAGGALEQVRAIAIQADGKIVVAGSTAAGTAVSQALVMRLNPDGSLDQTFDGDGSAVVPVSSSSAATAIGVQVDGRIVTIGYYQDGFYQDGFAMMHNADGSLVAGFGQSGIVTDLMGVMGGQAMGIALQDNGKIVVTGSIRDAANLAPDVAVIRLNANGSMDTTFAGTGRVIANITSDSDYGAAVAVQRDGKIVAAALVGYSSVFHGDTTDFAAVRYNVDGSPDLSWGEAGTARAGLFGFSGASSMAFDSAGRAVVAGQNRGMFGVVRFTADAPAAAFSISGRVTDANGRPVAGAILTLEEMGSPVRTAVTGSFGFYRFESVPGGVLYRLTARSKRHQFSPWIINLNKDLTINITAE